MVVHARDGKGEGKNYYDCKQNIVEPKFDFIPHPMLGFLLFFFASPRNLSL